MDIGQGQFPILSPQQADPIGYGLTQGSDLYHAMLQSSLLRQYGGRQMQAQLLQTQLANQLSQAQLPYAGQQAAANLAVTQAQPNLMGAQAGELGAEAAQTRFQTANPQLLAGPIGQALWASAHQGGMGNAQPNQIYNAISQQGAQSQQPSINSISSQFGWSQEPTGPMAPGGVAYNMLNPTGAAVRQAQLVSQVPQWHEILNSTAKDASDAQNALLNLEKFNSNYQSASNWEKGALGGRAPALTSSAQNMDQASTGLQLTQDQLLHLSRSTNMNLGLIGKSKPTRSLNEEAEGSNYSLLKSAFQRQQEQNQFMQAASGISQEHPGSMGANPSQLAQTLYQTYNQQYPIFDKSGKAQPQNLGQWKNYLTPEAVQMALQGKLDQLAPQSISIPKFNSKQQFQSWYQSLPTAQKSAVKSQLGGQ